LTISSPLACGHCIGCCIHFNGKASGELCKTKNKMGTLCCRISACCWGYIQNDRASLKNMERCLVLGTSTNSLGLSKALGILEYRWYQSMQLYVARVPAPSSIHCM
jgi:hypothetical protein